MTRIQVKAGIVLALGTICLVPVARSAPTCSIGTSFLQPDVDPVWNDKLKKSVSVKSKRTVLIDKDVVVFSEAMAVDADGSAHTYSAKDPFGTLCDPKKHPENVGKDPVALGCAMDQLCEGVNMRVPDGHGKFKVVNYEDCGGVAAAFQKAQAGNWKPADGTRIAASPGIEMTKKDGEIPCIDKDGAYLVSKTVPSGAGGGECEQAKWLDSLIPFIVVPQCWTAGYRLSKHHPEHEKECAAILKAGSEPDLATGELVALIARGAPDKPIFAVVGDAGPNGKLGEASVGLLMKSEGKTEPPSYVRATNGYDRARTFDVVIFRNARYTKPIIHDNYSDIENETTKQLEGWGGKDLKTGLALLAACGAKASPGAK